MVRPQTKVSETGAINKINAWTVGLAAGQREGAPLEFATDIARVTDDGDNLHILPIVTRGPTENVADLLYLRGVDVAIINSDSLEQFRAKVPDVQQKISYILSLFPSELHIMVRPEIKSLGDLKGKKVNFNTQGTAAAYSGPLIFDNLKQNEVQRTFIPPVPPTIPHLEIAAGYRPAGRGDEVGGDFYDAFQVGNTWLIVLGDVSGKGVDAAVVTTLVRHTVRALAVHSTLPSEILTGLNRVLLDHETDRFCTLVIMSLGRTGGHWSLTTSTGGHPLPVLVRDGRSGGIGGPGSLVGAFDDPEFVDATVELAVHDRVVLFTDGVTEGRDGDQYYGEDRLHRLLRTPSQDAAELAHAVVDDAVDFQGDLPRDDIAVVVLRVPPTD